MPSAEQRQATERGVRALARGSGIGIVGTALSQLSLLVIVVMLASTEGASGVGVYSQAFAIFTVITLVTLFGVQTTLTRYVADGLVSSQTHPSIRRLIAWGTRAPGLLGLVTGGGLVLLAPIIANGLLNEPDVTVPLQLMALGIPFATYSRSAAAALQGFGEVRQLVMITTILEPAARLLLTSVALFAGFGESGAGVAIVISNVVAAIYARCRLNRSVAARLTNTDGTETLTRREVLRFTVMTSSATIATTGLMWADTIILGAFLSSSTVGIYQVATRILAIASMAIAPIATAFAPQIADLLRRQEWDRLGSAYSLATIWSTRLAIPAISLCVVAPHQLAELVGRGNGVAVGATLVLAVGKLTEAATGPCGMVLNMSNRVGLNAVNNVAALVLNVALNLLLIPVWGLVGAAAAWSGALVLLNLSRSLEVRFVLGLKADGARVVKNVLLGLPALSAGWVIMHFVPSIVGVLIAGIVILVLCAAAYRLLDWTYSDTQVVRSLGNAEYDELDLAVRFPSSLRSRYAPNLKLIQRGVSRRPASGHTFPIDELISPLRLDVLVRASFFTFIRRHRELIAQDWDRFIWLARQEPYHVWFNEIVLPEVNHDRREGDPFFQARVRSAISLLESWEEHGFETGRPIQLWKTKRSRPTSSGKLVRREYFLGDGCHRLALLMLDNVTELGGDQVQVVPRLRFSPRDNTSALLSKLRMSEAAYLAFLARSYGAGGPVTSRGELLAGARGSILTELATVLTVDDQARAEYEGEKQRGGAERSIGASSPELGGWEGTAP